MFFISFLSAHTFVIIVDSNPIPTNFSRFDRGVICDSCGGGCGGGGGGGGGGGYPFPSTIPSNENNGEETY